MLFVITNRLCFPGLFQYHKDTYIVNEMSVFLYTGVTLLYHSPPLDEEFYGEYIRSVRYTNAGLWTDRLK